MDVLFLLSQLTRRRPSELSKPVEGEQGHFLHFCGSIEGPKAVDCTDPTVLQHLQASVFRNNMRHVPKSSHLIG
jgi:hypothetical protein